MPHENGKMGNLGKDHIYNPNTKMLNSVNTDSNKNAPCPTKTENGAIGKGSHI
jgi:hypothetical protein